MPFPASHCLHSEWPEEAQEASLIVKMKYAENEQTREEQG